MKCIIKAINSKQQNQTSSINKALFIIAIAFSLTLLPQEASARGFTLQAHSNSLNYATPLPTYKEQSSQTYQHTVRRGDTLGSIMKKAGVGKNKLDLKSQIERIMEADIHILALDVIEKRQVIKLWVDDNNQLQKLEITLNPARKVIYTRSKNNDFEYKDIHRDGIWRTNIIKGRVKKSFYVSARKAKLTPSEIVFIESLLDTQLNFSKNVNRGETFQVLRREQYIDGLPTGSHELLGVVYYSSNGYEHTAFLHDDGDFYTAEGRSLSKGFLRFPVAMKFRMSSRFNPYRKHPVTGRKRPHNGLDLATPIGTPIIAPGDGTVKLISKHKYAGQYVVIEHNGAYSTRYLHLSKPLVTEGQSIKQGEVIALSGNTGRTTGPHLHYELHKNGRPVNPLKAKVNASTSISDEHIQAFNKKMYYYNTFLNKIFKG